MTEQAISQKITRLLELKGYRVANEVPNLHRSADIAVIDDKNKIWIIECKINDIKKAIAQSKTHILSADKVFVATYYKNSRKQTIKHLNDAGIGLIYLMPDGTLDFVITNEDNIPFKPARDKLHKRIQESLP